jgi:hypothetical protein
MVVLVAVVVVVLLLDRCARCEQSAHAVLNAQPETPQQSRLYDLRETVGLGRVVREGIRDYFLTNSSSLPRMMRTVEWC